MLEAIHRLGYQLDEIVHVEIWATDDILATLPPVNEFKIKADNFIKERYGLDVKKVCAVDKNGEKLTFEKLFYSVPKNRKNKQYEGRILGFPLMRHRWCARDLKIKPQKKNGDIISYVGIAADETKRINNTQNAKSVLPLVDIGWTEEDAMRWCEENDIVSPTYNVSNRDGCLFCPCQGVNELRTLRQEYPELWEYLLKWDLDSPVVFNIHGHTIHDFDKRFYMEDVGLIDPTKRFLWSMVDNYPDTELGFVPSGIFTEANYDWGRCSYVCS